MSVRLAGKGGYPAQPNTFSWTYHPQQENKLGKWKKERHVFVVSMGDLFLFGGGHRKENADQRKVFKRMKAYPNHIYMMLTKRPENMLWWSRQWVDWWGGIPHNWWCGVTAENQQCADLRIPTLLQIPAAQRFVSIEPCLSQVNIRRYLPTRKRRFKFWVILGGETGPRARPCHPDWARSVRDQAVRARVPFFFKSFGNWRENPKKPTRRKYTGKGRFLRPDGTYGTEADWRNGQAVLMEKVKKKLDRLLDGREWNERPA